MMNNYSIIGFVVISLSLLGGALWLMWSAGTDIDNEPIKNYREGTWTTEVVKAVHPEMRDVEPGTELMGVTFEKKVSCDLEEYKDLQARIDELRSELEEDDEEDDDDDGDILIIRK